MGTQARRGTASTTAAGEHDAETARRAPATSEPAEPAPEDGVEACPSARAAKNMAAIAKKASRRLTRIAISPSTTAIGETLARGRVPCVTPKTTIPSAAIHGVQKFHGSR